MGRDAGIRVCDIQCPLLELMVPCNLLNLGSYENLASFLAWVETLKVKGQIKATRLLWQ